MIYQIYPIKICLFHIAMEKEHFSRSLYIAMTKKLIGWSGHCEEKILCQPERWEMSQLRSQTSSRLLFMSMSAHPPMLMVNSHITGVPIYFHIYFHMYMFIYIIYLYIYIFPIYSQVTSLAPWVPMGPLAKNSCFFSRERAEANFASPGSRHSKEKRHQGGREGEHHGGFNDV